MVHLVTPINGVGLRLNATLLVCLWQANYHNVEDTSNSVVLIKK